MSKVTIYSPPSAAQVKNCTADFDLRRAPVPIHLVQFDKTIPILAVALYKGGTAYKLPEDAEANVRMGKRNNLCIYNPVLGCNEGRTLVYVAVTPQMTTQDGVFYPILEVLAGGGVAGTSPLQLVIQRNPVQEGDLEDTSEAQTLADLASQAAASANAAANSAAAAKTSEEAAAKSAADADRTANSINESMTQIAANKEAVSQLKEDLADYEDALDIKLYKASLAESAPGIGRNWNLYYDMNIPAGTKVKVTLNSYSGTLFTDMQVRFFDVNGNMKNYGSIKSIGDTKIITTTDDYTRLWLQINRSAIENGVNASIIFATDRSGVLKALADLENTLNKKINEEILKASIVHTFHVEKDGTGDFTKLIDAIDEAEKYMDSVVYVGNGEWDIIDELGSDYVNSVSYTKRGIVLKNRIKLVFSSKSKVICDYSGDNTAIKNWLSPFNAGKHGFTLENLNIYSHNVRYSMHDERDSDGDFYINKYINCHFFNHNEKGGFRQCIGGGLGKNGYIVIENCVFENPKANNNSLVSYHNTANVGGGPAKSNIEVSNCYVKGSGTLRFSWYGTSTDITIVKATGNNLGSAIQFVAETSDGTSPNENVELYEWNNIIRSN